MATSEFPPNPNTLIGQVRLLISDWPDSPDGFIFDDAQVQAFLSMRKDNVTRAAASALMTIANNEVLLYKYVRTDDLTVDGVKGATELRLQARQLESQADNEDAADNEFFMVTYPKVSCGLEYEYLERAPRHGYAEWC